MADPTDPVALDLASLDRVGIRELRNHVAAVVRRASAGERVVITVDGRPVAQLGPLTPSGPASLDDLVAAGLARPARRHDRPAAPDPIDPPVDARPAGLLDALRGTSSPRGGATR